MKVLFDHQIFSLQKFGGVSKYYYELLRHLPIEEWETTTILSNNEYIKNDVLFKHLQILPNKRIKGMPRIMNELNKIYSAFKLSERKFDVFHQTHFQTYCLPFLKNKPMVTTFHDINFSTHDKNEDLVKIQKKSVERANKIIAVSHNTKKDLIDLWKISEDKIEVVYHGVDKPLKQNIIGDRLIENPYILYVGLRKEFKNFKRLAIAFKNLKQKFPFLKLVCTSVPFTIDEISFLTEQKIILDTIHISASEITMANLYTHAELFVYPSIYEGFGMPILEAMSYGCPTAISNSSCFPEIAQKCSLYFDPYSLDSIYDCLDQLLTNTYIKENIIMLGYELCKQFTWQKTAEGHREVYKSLI